MQLRLAPARRPGTAAARPAPLARPPQAKPTKAADFRTLPDADIDASVAESKRALFDMRIAQRTRQVRERKGEERTGGGTETPAQFWCPSPSPPSARIAAIPHRHGARERCQCANSGEGGEAGEAEGRGGGKRQGATTAAPDPVKNQPHPPFPPSPPQEFKPSDFGWHKKKIAQLLTVKRERTLAAGVTKRESRKAEKAEKVAAGFGQF